MVLKFVAVIFLGYLLGAIPFGVIATRLIKGVDVREYGSGKTGLTNVLRTGGIKAGAAVAVGDLGKGAAAVLLAKLIVGAEIATLGALEIDFQSAQVVAALAAIAGHNWSIFLKFQGGRGVAVFFGALLALYWIVGLSGGAILLVVMALTRYASLGSMSGAVGSFLVMLPLVLLLGKPVEYLIYTVVAGGLILFQHRDNIQRLRNGVERKLGKRAEKREPRLPIK